MAKKQLHLKTIYKDGLIQFNPFTEKMAKTRVRTAINAGQISRLLKVEVDPADIKTNEMGLPEQNWENATDIELIWEVQADMATRMEIAQKEQVITELKDQHDAELSEINRLREQLANSNKPGQKPAANTTNDPEQGAEKNTPIQTDPGTGVPPGTGGIKPIPPAPGVKKITKPAPLKA